MPAKDFDELARNTAVALAAASEKVALDVLAAEAKLPHMLKARAELARKTGGADLALVKERIDAAAEHLKGIFGEIASEERSVKALATLKDPERLQNVATAFLDLHSLPSQFKEGTAELLPQNAAEVYLQKRSIVGILAGEDTLRGFSVTSMRVRRGWER